MREGWGGGDIIKMSLCMKFCEDIEARDYWLCRSLIYMLFDRQDVTFGQIIWVPSHDHVTGLLTS